MAGISFEPTVFRWQLVPAGDRLRVEGPISRPAARRRHIELPVEGLDTELRQALATAADVPCTLRIGRRQFTVVGTEAGHGLFIDNSRQDRALAEFSRRVRQLEEGIDALPEAFVLYDDADRLLIANPRYAELYPTIEDLVRPGVTFTEIATAAVERGQFLFDGDMAEWLRRRLDFHRKGVGFFEQRLDDGRWIQLSERRTRSGGIASIRADITLLRQREAALEEAKLAAEQTSRSMSRFLAVFSHEVRNGLNGLVGAAQILALDARTSGQREQAELLFESSRRLTRVLSDLLDYLKNEATGVGIHPQPMDPRRILETAFAEFDALAAERGLYLALHVDPDIPGSVLGDAGRIHQVMANLTSNAVKYSRSGVITLALERTSDRLRYSVSDEGIGIDEQDLKGLFEFFSRASPDNPHSTGLGLAISRQIVVAMGGEIGVQSRRGRGSRFWFDVPLRPQAGAIEATEELPSAMPDRALRVGVLDDDPLSRSIAEHFLQRLGHWPLACQDGDEVLRHVHDGGLDALLLDLMMPGENGIDIAARIRTDRHPGSARLAIVVVTGNVLPDSLAACQAAGADAVVQKPLFIGSLDQVLRTAVAVRQGPGPVLPAATAERMESSPGPDTAVETAEKTLGLLRRDIGEHHFRVGVGAAMELFDALCDELRGSATPQGPGLLHRAQGTAPQLGFHAIGQAACALAALDAATAPAKRDEARRALAELLEAAAKLLRAHLTAPDRAA